MTTLVDYKKRVEALIEKMKEIEVIDDYRYGYWYLGYSYSKKTKYCLAIRSGDDEEKVYKIHDNTLRSLLNIYDTPDILTICLVVEDILKIMKEDQIEKMFILLYEVLERTLYEALYFIEEEQIYG